MKIQPSLGTAATLLSLLLFGVQLPDTFAQGDLTPPGAPAPTMKTLEQVEPRTPISSIPYTISEPGSYYLTTNLVRTAGNGVSIDANSVTLDLNGFAIIATNGPVVHPGVSVLGAQTNICVRNGSIQGWNFGVTAYSAVNLVLRDLQVFGNSTGLRTGSQAVIDRCVASENTNAGIWTLEGSLVTSCLVANNGDKGIDAGSHCTIIDCVAHGNGGTGIDARSSFVTRCTSADNGECGIFADSVGAKVTDCNVLGNAWDGIYVQNHSEVRGNNVNGLGTSNPFACIRVSNNGNRVEGNDVSAQQIGIRIDGVSNLVIDNNAYLNATNYLIVAGNAAGPIITDATITTNTNPYANFAP